MFSTVLHLLVLSEIGFARKEELTLYETIAALTSNTTCPMPAILGDSTCTVLPSDIYGAKIPFPWCTWSLENRYFVTFFVFYTASVMLSPRFIQEAIFYTQSVMLSPRFSIRYVFSIPFLVFEVQRRVTIPRGQQHVSSVQVKSCSARLVPGWVNKSEYPVLQ